MSESAKREACLGSYQPPKIRRVVPVTTVRVSCQQASETMVTKEDSQMYTPASAGLIDAAIHGPPPPYPKPFRFHIQCR